MGSVGAITTNVLHWEASRTQRCTFIKADASAAASAAVELTEALGGEGASAARAASDIGVPSDRLRKVGAGGKGAGRGLFPPRRRDLGIRRLSRFLVSETTLPPPRPPPKSEKTALPPPASPPAEGAPASHRAREPPPPTPADAKKVPSEGESGNLSPPPPRPTPSGASGYRDRAVAGGVVGEPSGLSPVGGGMANTYGLLLPRSPPPPPPSPPPPTPLPGPSGGGAGSGNPPAAPPTTPKSAGGGS